MSIKMLLAVLFFVASTATVSAQMVNRQFVPGINFDSDKYKVIATVLTRMRTYYENNTDGIIKRAGKIHGINLKNKKKLEEFLINMEEDLATLLDITDDWTSLDLTTTYGVALYTLLGQNMEFAGYGSANQGKRGTGVVNYTFKGDKIATVSGSLEITKDYAIFSGFNYDNAHLTEAAANLRVNFGNFTFRQYNNIWNSCSSNPENVPMVEYTITSDPQYTAILTFEYGIYQRKISKYECRAIGNHLTRISFTVCRR